MGNPSCRWLPGVVALGVYLAVMGCSKRSVRMEHPADPKGSYAAQISAAKRLLDQREDWADRAEWEVLPLNEGWELIAWRIHYPDKKGPSRYLPWGYATIRLDRNLKPIYYKKRG